MKQKNTLLLASVGLVVAGVALIIAIIGVINSDAQKVKQEETVLYTTKSEETGTSGKYSGDKKSNPAFNEELPQAFDIGESNEEYQQDGYYVDTLKIESIDKKDVLVIKGNLRILDEMGNVEKEVKRLELYFADDFQFFTPGLGDFVTKKECKEYLEADGYKTPTSFTAKVKDGKVTYLSYSD